MNIVNKICTCLCCYSCACSTAQCIDCWHAYEACGIANIECGNCCWTIFAPICHSCSLGDTGAGFGHCTTCVKYCLYSCAVYCCAPIDGIYNCVKYICAVCGEGVTGYGDILKNTKWVANMIRSSFDLPEPPQPVQKMQEYRPWWSLFIEIHLSYSISRNSITYNIPIYVFKNIVISSKSVNHEEKNNGNEKIRV